MSLSVFDLFTIGIGPSSSHTVGPMRAARLFATALREAGALAQTRRVHVELYGSLGHTGVGHGTDRAVLLGLEGETPEAVDPDRLPVRSAEIEAAGELRLLGEHPVGFERKRDLVFHKRQTLPRHPNGMRFAAFGSGDAPLRTATSFSIGGGFVVDDAAPIAVPEREETVPHPFASGAELLQRCRESGLSVATLVLENERVRRSAAEVREGLLRIWAAMRACIDRGCEREGILPGGLKVRRRAAALARRLRSSPGLAADPLQAMDWVNLWALAVNEENAAGGRVVTAPTNGAAGILPAVGRYYQRFTPEAEDEGIVRYLLAAGAVGIIYKLRASISGAEVGCQGEVGVACSMAAAGLTEALGGTPAQVEEAAEIGMEHNLGLTCDPVGGLVQVPCIERNAMGAVKAINASRLALRGDGVHAVSLDRVIETMRQTGRDMKTKYKETSRGGLAVNVIEC